ncbi:MAG: OmpH family outer membrane protein [Lentisphaerae bacterium]|nr:MAG: OmpH family outer membrane protein [Lentisphaerota bacterium]
MPSYRHFLLLPITCLLVSHLSIADEESLIPSRTPKIAIVNLRSAMRSFWKYKIVQAKIQQEKKEAEKKVQAMVASDNDLIQEIKLLRQSLQSPLLSEEAKKKKSEELRQRQETFVRNRNEHMQQANQLKKQLLERRQNEQQRLISDIKTRLAEFCRVHHIDIVFDSTDSEFAPAFVLYANPVFDVTDKFIKVLNADAPQSTPEADKPAQHE